MKICPNCGYERQHKDEGIIPETECPKCGVIYAKVEKVKGHKEDSSQFPQTIPIAKKDIDKNAISYGWLFNKKIRNGAILLATISLITWTATSFFSGKTNKAENKKREVDISAFQDRDGANFPIPKDRVEEGPAHTFESVIKELKDAKPDLVDLAESILPSVVKITCVKKEGKGTTGSGFFISTSGHIITNYHVLGNALAADVQMFDGESYPILSILDENKQHDLVLALVDLQRETKPITIANDYPKIGERVVAFGSPMGLEKTVSDGIVSAIRVWDQIKVMGELIQTTAPISPGSSGGPLVNMKGELIAINTLSYQERDKFGRIPQNINFSVPAMHVLNLSKYQTLRYLARMTDFESQMKVAANKNTNTVFVRKNNEKGVEFSNYLPGMCISRDDGSIDKDKYYDWLLHNIGNPNDAEKIAEMIIDRNKDILYSRLFRLPSGDVRPYEYLTIEQKQIWEANLSRLRSWAYSKVPSEQQRLRNNLSYCIRRLEDYCRINNCEIK